MQDRQPSGVPTGGQFIASARSEADVTLVGPTDTAARAAQQILDDVTTLDGNGRRWVETDQDWHTAEKARLEVPTPTPFADLKPNDRFVIEERDRLVECRVLTEAYDATDRSGNPTGTGFIEVRRMDNGMTILHAHEPGSTARKVGPPVHLRVDPADIPTEHDLNEAWGV